ncbi:MAG: UDP-N-acetylmuramoyl-L-alanine--D-glutamate ligase [Gammaproteobacteria bacterium]|nr:UDP-N-acetylmuramoyl-L-alanine--D-glutamate ligase [Gammaproteobacteria bacterium]
MDINKKYVVVGLGKTGISCVRFLRDQGCDTTVVDSRAQPPGELELARDFPNVELFCGKLEHDVMQLADVLVVSPGVALRKPAIKAQIARGVEIVGDIELFARVAEAPIVAITGSNGKSTVTTLVGDMAKQAGLQVGVGGNLGVPALDLLSVEKPDLYVLELSSFQLETTRSLKAAAATVLNISPDHMDRYDSLADYVAAKMRIYSNCKAAVINKDMDPVETHSNPSQKIYFTLSKPGNDEFGVRDGYLALGDQLLMPICELKIKGRHQIANALAALALGDAIGLSMNAMLVALRAFSGLEHRCQWVRRLNGVDWINDSKGTNVGATQAAISGLGESTAGKIVLLAGGEGKGADFSVLLSVVQKYVRTVILFGHDSEIIAAALTEGCKIVQAESLAQAVTIAANEAQSDDVVLLSPACASFDMFKNFEDRGEQFMQEVKKLK